LSNIFKYFFWQVKLFDFILVGIFLENLNFIKQNHYSDSINMITLNFIINIHNYQLVYYYNYYNYQLYIYNINRYYIFKFYYLCENINVNRLHK
jgi:hypothetical protein